MPHWECEGPNRGGTKRQELFLSPEALEIFPKPCNTVYVYTLVFGGSENLDLLSDSEMAQHPKKDR